MRLPLLRLAPILVGMATVTPLAQPAALVIRGASIVDVDTGAVAARTVVIRGDTIADLLPADALAAGAAAVVDGPGEADDAFRPVANPAEARAAVDDLVDAGVDFIKVQAALSRESYHAVARESQARRTPFAGHVPVAVGVREALAAGQRSLEHLSPAPVSDAAVLFACSSREAELHAELQAIERERPSLAPAVIRARETALRRALVESFDDARARRLGAAIRDRHAWLVPTLVWSARVRPGHADEDGEDTPLEFVPAVTRERWRQGRARYLSAASPDDLQAAASYTEGASRALGALAAGGAPVLAGTDSFDAFVIPGASLHEELARLVGAGLTPLAALQAATRNAAAYRGAEATEGRIGPGRLADLVLLDANPLADIHNLSRVRAVVRGGRLFGRADLDRLLGAARDAAAR